ncbi:hypothetical protein M419DRAFT_119457 [Trichoderma reesei RUT C-30]|uniref:Uncharacterized protein n=1 Tax=Hypocrea jecorina (strain ATCC 56765 / BCRC 32924 / NRRL 11460 / Rut C-30) TaxID=1344414 RepID=A0A024S9K4_HYPJR|nr:hypothetical protein M419DRAFT_119457 [Trichoderma reesei RUT C-30]
MEGGGGGGTIYWQREFGRESCTTTITSTEDHSGVRRGIPWDVDDSTVFLDFWLGYDGQR